jgi:hypothetical protein
MPTDTLSELAFNQPINSFRSFAGIVFLPTSINEVLISGMIGAKSFNTS